MLFSYRRLSAFLALGFILLSIPVAALAGGLTTPVKALTSSPITASIAQYQYVTCYGTSTGWASVSATGGTLPYTYSWNTTPVQTTDTASNLPAGTYTVTVTDATSSTATAIITILQPAQLTSTATVMNVSCFNANNGKASASPAGGRMPYTYSWNSVPSQTTDTAINLGAGTYIVYVNDSSGCTTSDTITITQPAVLASTSTLTNLTCFNSGNGSATAHPTGGTSPFTYSWSCVPSQTSQSASGLAAGTYSVVVTDNNGCTTADTVTLTQPSLLKDSVTHTGITCTGPNSGTATAHPSGGTAPYTYSWNSSPSQTTQTATALPPSQYIIFLTDANGCTRQDTTVIGSQVGLTSTVQISNVICNGAANGSATVTPSGGLPPYTYNWNTSPPQTTQTATGLAPGTYIVTVNDAGNCTTTDTVTINEAPPFVLNLTQTPVGCSIQMTANSLGGMAPYTWSWTTSPVQTTQSVTTNISGTYTATITDAYGCTLTDTMTIYVAPPPPVPTITMIGDTLVSSAGSSNQWLLYGVPLYGAIDSMFVPSVNGVYTVQVSNGTCTVTSAPFTYTIAGIHSQEKGAVSMTVYPNPNEGEFDLVLTAAPAGWIASITDVTGRELNTFKLSDSGTAVQRNYHLSLSNLGAGVYLVSLKDAKGNALTHERVVIR